jgi:hypothetical protein
MVSMCELLSLQRPRTVTNRSPSSLKESSEITIKLFHVKSASKEVLLGTAVIAVRDWLPHNNETICTFPHISLRNRDKRTMTLHTAVAREYTIHKTGINLQRAGLVVVSLNRRYEDQSSVTQESAIPSTIPVDGVLAELERAEATTAQLKGYHGAVVDNITTVTSSDVCITVIGYVEKVVQFGDIISQVTLYSSFGSSPNVTSISRFTRMQSSHGRC